jgi:hypothetical protein
MPWAPTSLAYARTHSDPLVWFDSPDDVVASIVLSRAEKLDILRRWHRQTLARAEDASLDERSGLLSLGIARAIQRVYVAAEPCEPGPVSGRQPRPSPRRTPEAAPRPRRRGIAEG